MKEGPGHHVRARRGRDAFNRGHLIESLAVLLLRLKGYRVLARNWRSSAGEIDVIARHRRQLIVIEVKQRPTLEAAISALTANQRRRLARSAAAFIGTRPDLAALPVRFDVFAFTRGYFPVHIRDAWRPDGS